MARRYRPLVPQPRSCRSRSIILRALPGSNLTIGDTNTGDLSMLAGKINTGSFSVVIPRPCGAGWLSSRAAGSWINGNLQLTAPSYGASCFLPVGDANNFAPITFSYPWHDPPLGGTITGRTTAGDHPDTSSGISGISVGKSVNRYWTRPGTPAPSIRLMQFFVSIATAVAPPIAASMMLTQRQTQPTSLSPRNRAAFGRRPHRRPQHPPRDGLLA